MAMITQATLAVQALTLGVLDLAGLVTIPIVFGLSLALGFANAFDNPARRIPLGIGGAGFATGMNAITQQECPSEMRGRILAPHGRGVLRFHPIGGPITGWVGDAVGAEWSLACGAIISLAAVAVLGRWALSRGSPVRGVPDLRNLRRNVVAVGPSPHERS